MLAKKQIIKAIRYARRLAASKLPACKIPKNSKCLHSVAPFQSAGDSCCANCNSSYWKTITIGKHTVREQDTFTPAERKVVQSRYKKRKGYLTERGCSLPRGLRPYLCLTFYCGRAQKSLTDRQLCGIDSSLYSVVLCLLFMEKF